LHRDDGQSILQWVEWLKGDILAFKSSAEAAPAGSGLDADSFVLILQTEYQREVFEKEGHSFAGIDATHNTTHYVNTSLFTVIVRDRWGHGKQLIICITWQDFDIIHIGHRIPGCLDDFFERKGSHH